MRSSPDVVRVLGLDAAEVRRLAAADARERWDGFQRWLGEPVRPVLADRRIAQRADSPDKLE